MRFIFSLFFVFTGCTTGPNIRSVWSMDPALALKIREKRNPKRVEYKACHYVILGFGTMNAMTEVDFVRWLLQRETRFEANALLDVEYRLHDINTGFYDRHCISVSGEPVKL